VTKWALLARHPVSLAGAALTTASAATFVALAIAAFAGLFDNPYAGLVIFIAIPALFVLGLLLIPLGMRLQRRKLTRDPSADAWPVIDFGRPRVRRAMLAIVALTAVNIVILLLAGYGSLHSMETPEFCGQTCHTPMHPQFTAWQDAPHSEVACVKCHVGEGARSFVRYKLAGVRQLVHVVTNSYPRPIPPAPDMLRPALEICGRCHWPERPIRDPVRVIREYADDETNTETTTMLQMFVGGPGQPTASGRAIHWHADPSVRVEYVATDETREVIPYVKVTDSQGRIREYQAEGTTPESIAQGHRRVMDCIDCHNTVAHRVSPTVERALDVAMAAGRIDRRLPFVKREGVRVLSAEYPSQDAAVQAIDQELNKFYSARTGFDERALKQTIANVQGLYRRNVFPAMKVKWGTYPDQLGHVTSTGCFRCHDGGHTAKDGSTISGDCELCHKQLEGR
jgi:nitrate/TMAO reductase-like tetraheme cytochrome c subunit